MGLAQAPLVPLSCLNDLKGRCSCDVQVAFNAIVAGTLFLRTRLHPNNLDDANLYLAVLFFSLTSMLFNNWVKLLSSLLLSCSACRQPACYLLMRI